MNKIYKIIKTEIWNDFQEAGSFLGSPVDIKDGFIHFSYAHQLYETARKHFAGQRELILFAVASAPLGDVLRIEPSRGGDNFPHLYDALKIQHVLWSKPLLLDENLVPILPNLD